MVNDSVINFYLRYTLTQYIDSSLRREGIDLQKAQDLASHPEKMKDAYSPKTAEEEAILSVLRPLYNRFAVATSFIYPQLRKLHSVESVSCVHDRNTRRKRRSEFVVGSFVPTFCTKTSFFSPFSTSSVAPL